MNNFVNSRLEYIDNLLWRLQQELKEIQFTVKELKEGEKGNGMAEDVGTDSTGEDD